MATTGGYIAGDVRAGYAISISPEVWKTVEGLKSLTAPMLQTKKIDTTRYGTSRLMTNIPGLDEVTDPAMTLIRDASSSVGEAPVQNSLYALKAARTSSFWRFEIASQDDPTVNLFEAYAAYFRVGDIKPGVVVGDLNTLEVTLVFDGSYFNHYPPAASQLGPNPW